MAEQGGKQSTYLFAPILLIAVLFACAVIRGPNILAQSGFGSAILVAAPLILATYGLMALAVAGRGTVDLAVGPLVAFINVTVVKLNDLGAVTGPFGVFVVALGIGVIYQLLFAFVILFVRVQPIIVALSGFLVCPASISSSYRARPGQRRNGWRPGDLATRSSRRFSPFSSSPPGRGSCSPGRRFTAICE